MREVIEPVMTVDLILIALLEYAMPVWLLQVRDCSIIQPIVLNCTALVVPPQALLSEEPE